MKKVLDLATANSRSSLLIILIVVLFANFPITPATPLA